MTETESQVLLILFGGIFFAILMTLFVVGVVLIHRQRQAKNRQKIAQLQAEFEKTILNVENEIQQETLAQVGRELHDNIGQLLSLTKLNLNSSKPEKQQEAKGYVNQVIKEVRALSKTLNLDWVESLSLDEFITQQLERVQATGFCETSLQSDQSFAELKKEEKLVLIRVIQESLNNAIKHAEPNHIQVRIHRQGPSRILEIADDGLGFDSSQKSSGSGMHNLHKRMETIGGKCSVSSSPGEGTSIRIELPV
ncbi:histidine kinase [Algoriphagus sp. H41]|uniref:histidine kinase n=1 Tax=Algoriphagus oliviformis TaxID=2811231 RepID=A0ABS3BYV2_9BACT|nr:ATP-binding protein [Algoriphagus oliviformis]MBN7810037.1 histidine kinase [Algoriphagus oliviformis]